MHYLILIFLAMPLWSASQKEINEARQSITTLIGQLIPGHAKTRPKGTEKFRVDQCPEHKVDWADVLLMKKTVTLSYRFSPGCDIQGDITPKMFTPFPASLDLKNLNPYQKVEAQNKIIASLESKPILLLEIRQGVLNAKKGAVKFEADYRVKINPLHTKEIIEENLGGEIRITEIFGQKTSIKEKVLVK